MHHISVTLLETLKASKLLPIIFKSPSSANSNLFKGTENPFHFLVLSFSFFFLFNVGTLNMFKVLRLWKSKRRVEMLNDRTWDSLVFNHCFIAIYHHLSSIALSRTIYASLRSSFYSDIFTVYL